MVSIDAVAKRYHPVIVCGLLATIAYFQGSGIGSLIAEHLPSASGPSTVATSLDKTKKAPTPSPKSGATILSRNPFDSVTGPLTGKPPPVAVHKPAEHKQTGEPPTCPKGDVTLIAGALDPSYSFAVITTGNESKMRRIGDEVDGKTVESIGGERVVLASGTDRCQLRMHGDAKGSSSPGAVGMMAPSNDEGGPEVPGPMGRAPMGQVSGITKVSDTEYVLEDDGAAKLLQMQQGLMKSSKLVDGKGLRLYRAAQTTILGQLGLKKGDIVKTVNGFDMSSLDETAQAYSNMKSAKSLQVVVERDGKPVTIDYTVH